MKTLLICTVALGTALGLALPAYDRTRQDSPAATEVVLHRSSDHHFYAEATVDGKSVRFLVDTGSSAIALTEEDAKRLGIVVKPGQYELIGQGASGLVRGKAAEVDLIELGEIRQENAKVMVVEGAEISLLGQPFLEQVDEIVIRKDEMLLRSGSGA
jgi:aspartyl protease family protein